MNVPKELNKDNFSLTENDKGYIINHDFKWIPLEDLKEIDFRPQILVDVLKKENKVFNHLIYNRIGD